MASRKASQLAAGGSSSSLRVGGAEGSAASGLESQQSSSFRSVPPSPARPGSQEVPQTTPRSARSAGSGRNLAQAQPAAAAAQQPSRPPLPDRVGKLKSSKSTPSLADSMGSQESSAGSDKLLEQAAAAAATPAAGRSQLGAAAAAGQQADAPLPHPGGKEHKGKSAALRFLSGLRSKKDKYQQKDRGLAGRQVGRRGLAWAEAASMSRWQISTSAHPRWLHTALLHRLATPAVRRSPRSARTTRARTARRRSGRWRASCWPAARARAAAGAAAWRPAAAPAVWIAWRLAATSCRRMRSAGGPGDASRGQLHQHTAVHVQMWARAQTSCCSATSSCLQVAARRPGGRVD